MTWVVTKILSQEGLPVGRLTAQANGRTFQIELPTDLVRTFVKGESLEITITRAEVGEQRWTKSQELLHSNK